MLKNILNYYFRLQQSSQPLNEAKLILLGSSGVGKTSIINRLVHGAFEKTNTTHGISTTEWRVPIGRSEEARLHIWDFGGQEILHATHQLFLSSGSLYLVVVSGREAHADADVDYWLQLIETFGPDSPVIVVLNKVSEYRFDLNRRAIQKKFPAVRHFISTDCADGTGISELAAAIAHESVRLPSMGAAFPASWAAIKEHCSSMSRRGDNYISFEHFRALCSEFGESNAVEQERLADVLHSLGIALNFRDDPRLQDTSILSPLWLTNGIYGLLTWPDLRARGGELHLADLATALDAKLYPREKHSFLLDVMVKFELCFAIPDDAERRYLLPQLLPNQEPTATSEFDPDRCLGFQYHYQVFPEGLLPRFIVRTHILSEKQPRWRTGVILAFEGNKALISADVLDRKTSILVAGPPLGRRQLLAVIRSDFERIHSEIRALHVAEMVPLPGHPNAHVPYEKLVALEKAGAGTFQEYVDGTMLRLDVQELLSGVDIEGMRKPKKESKSVSVFISYSHKDESLRRELETHLKLLQREGLISSWHDRQITAGEEWRTQIDKHLEAADIILLLVSADFIASDYSYDVEIARALKRQKEGTARVVPLILRDVDWHSSPFGSLQALPTEGRPVTLWRDKDSAWKSVALDLRKIIQRSEHLVPPRVERALFVAGIRLRNIRCFEDVTVNLSSETGVRNVSLLFGDNGVGKSTLLRCLAAGLCDTTAATALLESIHGDLLRTKTEEGLISVEVRRKNGDQTWTIDTLIRPGAKASITIEQRVPADLPREEVFVCGYGAGRRAFGTKDYSVYTPKDAVGTLFDYDASLQNPELAFRRGVSRNIPQEDLTRSVDAILMLDPGSTRIDSAGITIRGPWGEFVPAGALGDGFQSTLAWVADLLGWSLLYDPESLLSDVSGIVLIDELEQHLHPQWQREVIRLLRRQFPNIQFIATSHAPMCALGMTALSKSEAGIVRLFQREDHVAIFHTRLPEGQRADDVLTSPLFGLFSASGFDVSADIQEYTQLTSKRDRTPEDDARRDELQQKLATTLSPFENDYQRRIESRIREALEVELSDALASGALPSEVLDFELRRRLAKVLE